MNSFSSTQQQQIRSLQKSTSNCYSTVENNIVDIKNFYVNYLISILKPSLIDGIKGLFEDVIKTKESRNVYVQDLKLFKNLSLPTSKYPEISIIFPHFCLNHLYLISLLIGGNTNKDNRNRNTLAFRR